MNLPADLHLVGNQQNVALAIFFVPYILFEVPSNICLKFFKPHVWLAGCMLSFGVLMICQGFVQNYSGILATRFFLGLAEAGIFPGSFYIISFWYRREDAQKRFTFYWCSVLIATAFGGLLAGAIANMNGIAGYSNWRWVFILEGIATILVGVLAYFAVTDFPEDAKWLTDAERKWVLAHTQKSKDEVVQTVKFHDIVEFFKVPRNVLGGIIYFTILVPIYGFAYFAPTIIKGLGYSTVQTQLHTVPPVAAALALAVILAVLSDRMNLRGPFVFCCMLLTLVGIVMLLTIHKNFSPQYAGICFIAMGAFAGGPIWVCWFVMNFHGHVERSIGTGWMVAFRNIGGIEAIFAFLATLGPNYTQGYSALLSTTVVGLFCMVLYTFLCWRENKTLASDAQASRPKNSY